MSRRLHGRHLVASALVVVALGWASGVRAALSLNVMTFNIRTANGRDGDNAWPNRRALVADTIRACAPQVVGLQEVVDDQLEYLASRLHDYRWLGVDRGLNGGQGLSEYAPIFYRRAELSPLESGTFWLSGTSDAPPAEPGRRGRGSRIVTWARFYHLSTGRQIYVFNTHFSPRRGQVQVDSAKRIRERVATLPAGRPVIVTGDFNAIAVESDVWRELTAGGLKDAWMEADERRGPVVTMGDFGPPHDGDTTRIDWILVNGPLRVRSVETIVHNEQGRYPSDHYPVSARLELP